MSEDQARSPVVRLLSPTRRRIVTVGPARRAADPHLEPNLRHAGWLEYHGPAQTTQGWVVPGSDITVDRAAVPMHENTGQDW